MAAQDPLRDRILNWGLANVFHQKFDLENRTIAKQMGGEQLESIPFGGAVSNTTNYQGSPLAAIGQAAVLALGIGAGGLGLANLAGLVGGDKLPEETTPSAIAAPAEPVIVEGIIDWEFNGDEFRIDHDRDTD